MWSDERNVRKYKRCNGRKMIVVGEIKLRNESWNNIY